MDNAAIEKPVTCDGGGVHHQEVGKVNGNTDLGKEEVTTEAAIILITGLSDEISGRDLKKFLRQFGKVGKIKLMMIKTSGTCTGKVVNRRFAHVTVPSEDSADQLVGKIKEGDCSLKGSRLQVTKAPEKGPMSANYADSSISNPNKNGHGDSDKTDKSAVKPADKPSSSSDIVDGPEIDGDRGLMYSDQSSHNTPSPTPTISVKPDEIQLISDGEITDECTDDVVSSSNQKQNPRRDHRQRRIDPEQSRGKGNRSEEQYDRRDRPRYRRTCSSPPGRRRSVMSRRRRREESSSGVESESPRGRQWRKRLREESLTPPLPRRAGPAKDSMAGSGSDGDHNDRGRRGRNEKIERSPSQQSRGIMTYEEIKEAQRQRNRMRQKMEVDEDGKCRRRSEDRGHSPGNKRCSSKESRASRELERLERAQQKLRDERKKMEMEKLELIKLQREQQRKEMEKIEREKERVRRAKERLLSKEESQKTKTSRFGKTIAEQVVEEMRQYQTSQESMLSDTRRRRNSISPPPAPSTRRRSPERKEERYSHKSKPNFSWEDDDDDNAYSPPRRNSKLKRVSSSVRSPELLFKDLRTPPPPSDGSLRGNRVDLLKVASTSTSSNSLGYSSSYSGRMDTDSGKDAVEEFLGKIRARTITHASSQWKFGGSMDIGGTGAASVRATVGTSLLETVSVSKPSSQAETFIDFLGSPYTISPLVEPPDGTARFPRAGRLSDAIANLYDNQNGTGVQNSSRGKHGGGTGGSNGGRGLFIHGNRQKIDFQRYYQGS